MVTRGRSVHQTPGVSFNSLCTQNSSHSRLRLCRTISCRHISSCSSRGKPVNTTLHSLTVSASPAASLCVCIELPRWRPQRGGCRSRLGRSRCHCWSLGLGHHLPAPVKSPPFSSSQSSFGCLISMTIASQVPTLHLRTRLFPSY